MRGLRRLQLSGNSRGERNTTTGRAVIPCAEQRGENGEWGTAGLACDQVEEEKGGRLHV
jgi:hypothetical protein